MSEVLELRQYTLRPGRRDDLIDLFDRELVESQEAVGARVLGQFRDLDDADRFVWLRGFADLATRGTALPAFYGGPVWRAHRDKANDTMVDSDDVLLLRPAGQGLDLAGRARGGPTTLVTITLYHLPPGGADDFLDFFSAAVRPLLTDTGAPPLAVLRTLAAENNFPPLPIRENENVVAWVASFPDAERLREHVRQLGNEPRWTYDVLPALTRQLARPAEQLQLAPTDRSLLR